MEEEASIKDSGTTRKISHLEWQSHEIILLKTLVKEMMKDGKTPWKKNLARGGFQAGRNPKQLKSKWERLKRAQKSIGTRIRSLKKKHKGRVKI